jgi:hypothetical protein
MYILRGRTDRGTQMGAEVYVTDATRSSERAIDHVAASMGGRSVQDVIELLVAAGYRAMSWTLGSTTRSPGSPGRLAEMWTARTPPACRPRLSSDGTTSHGPRPGSGCAAPSARPVQAAGRIESIGLHGPLPWRSGSGASVSTAPSVTPGRPPSLPGTVLERAGRRRGSPWSRGARSCATATAPAALARLDSAPLASTGPQPLRACGDDVCDADAPGAVASPACTQDASGTRSRGRGLTFLLPGRAVLVELLRPWTRCYPMCAGRSTPSARRALGGDPAAVPPARRLVSGPDDNPPRPGRAGSAPGPVQRSGGALSCSANDCMCWRSLYSTAGGCWTNKKIARGAGDEMSGHPLDGDRRRSGFRRIPALLAACVLSIWISTAPAAAPEPAVSSGPWP